MGKLHFSKEIFISGKRLAYGGRTFIIAEAGVNHNGSMEAAKKLIDAASLSGADAVKFQSFKTDKLILNSIEKAPYQKKTTNSKESQYEMLKKLEMDIEQMKELKVYAEQRKLLFMSTPFEEESLKEICRLDVPAIKVAATDVTNIKFLRQIAQMGKPVILSAGMCYMDEIRKALEAIIPFNKEVILLQCTANYPILDEEANLNVIRTLQKEFDILVGYSDHSKGVGAAPYAVAMGAVLVEKHFTLSKEQAGPDHQASLNPDELKELVTAVRTVEKYRGVDVKEPTDSEKLTRKSLQKCLVAKKKIRRGEIFTEEAIEAKRTNGQGISAIEYDLLIGRSAIRDYEANEIIDEKDLGE